jgi:hypothetical protein
MSAPAATDEPVHVESQSDLESFVSDHDIVLVDYSITSTGKRNPVSSNITVLCRRHDGRTGHWRPR